METNPCLGHGVAGPAWSLTGQIPALRFGLVGSVANRSPFAVPAVISPARSAKRRGTPSPHL